MIDESKLRLDAARAARARALLDNELLIEAFTKLETDYVAAWKLTPARDNDGRERLWQAVQIVGKIKDHLATVIENGKLAEAELKQLAERPRRFGIV
jgi:hypothetical protein